MLEEDVFILVSLRQDRTCQITEHVGRKRKHVFLNRLM